MAKKTSETDDVKQALTSKRRKGIPLADFVSTGSTLLNLACSDRANGGFAKGKYYYLVGDSTSGKTWLSLTCFAEASINANFANYDFYFDDVEDGALMNIAQYFGQRVADRMKSPGDVRGEPGSSTTVESFYYNLDDCIKHAKKKGRPFIYVLDSQDSLDSSSAAGKFEEQKEAFQKGKDSAGSYGDGKAKAHSENIRRALIGLRETDSILIIIGQTRDNLGFGFEKKSRSGGKSLRFYATLEMWASVKEKIKKNVKGKPRTIGVVSEVQIKKNRFTGANHTIQIPIYHSVGIDDVGSCVDYLLEEKHWTLAKGKREDDADDKARPIEAPEFEFTGSRGALIRHIEENNYEQDLQNLVQGVWEEIKESCAVHRKNKYAS